MKTDLCEHEGQRNAIWHRECIAPLLKLANEAVAAAGLYTCVVLRSSENFAVALSQNTLRGKSMDST